MMARGRSVRGGGIPAPAGSLIGQHLAGMTLSERQKLAVSNTTHFPRTPDEKKVEATEGTFDVPRIPHPPGSPVGVFPRAGGPTTTKLRYSGPGRYMRKTGRRVDAPKGRAPRF